MDQDYESRLLRQINIQENASPVVSYFSLSRYYLMYSLLIDFTIIIIFL